MTISNFAFSIRLDVRFRDCDSQGHVNNAVFFTYLEQCRLLFWRHMTGGAPNPHSRVIVARAECDYRAPAYFGEQLEVRLNVGDIGRSSFQLWYEIVNAASGARLAEGKSVMVTYDYDAGKSVPIPAKTRELLERFQPPPEPVRPPVE